MLRGYRIAEASEGSHFYTYNEFPTFFKGKCEHHFLIVTTPKSALSGPSGTMGLSHIRRPSAETQLPAPSRHRISPQVTESTRIFNICTESIKYFLSIFHVQEMFEILFFLRKRKSHILWHQSSHQVFKAFRV